MGKKDFRKLLAPIQKPPSYEEDPSYYSDWGDPREYTIGDIGIGECAGELVPFAEFGLQAAEQELHEAQDALENNQPEDAAVRAFNAMVTAAKALVRHLDVQCKDNTDDVVQNFKTHLDETKLFHDPFAQRKVRRLFVQVARRKKPTKVPTLKAHISFWTKPCSLLRQHTPVTNGSPKPQPRRRSKRCTPKNSK